MVEEKYLFQNTACKYDTRVCGLMIENCVQAAKNVLKLTLNLFHKIYIAYFSKEDFHNQ